MSAVSASVSITTENDLPPPSNQTPPIPWQGREVRHVSVGTETRSEPQADESARRFRELAIEIGRWASYFLAWAIPAVVYVAGVAFAALISPYTVAASLPAFIGSCAVVHTLAIPAIRERFNGLREPS